MYSNIYVGRISEYLEEEYFGGFRDRRTGVSISRRISCWAEKEFSGGNDKSAKVVELKKVE